MNAAAEVRDTALFDVELPLAPYPGLRPFEGREWPIFFGREPMIRDVIARLLDRNLVLVHGDSGCGKSSLIQAGVLVQLEQQHERGGQKWRTCAMLPREAPLRRLAQALAGLKRTDPPSDLVRHIRRILNAGRTAAVELEELLCTDPADRVCILVEQFEGLFEFGKETNADEAQLFVDVLAGLLEEAERRRGPSTVPVPIRIYAILVMRSEFLGEYARLDGLIDAFNDTQYFLRRMNRAELLRGIREPALLYDREITIGLAERLIADAGNRQDRLSLIQFGLMLLWSRKFGPRASESGLAEPPPSDHYGIGQASRLGLEDYTGGGGLAALVSAHADEVMATAASEPARREVAQHMLQSLLSIYEGQAIRRPRTFAELLQVTGSDEQTLREIIDHFRADDALILIPHATRPIESATPIDISHDVLVDSWQTLVAIKRRLEEERRPEVKTVPANSDNEAQKPQRVRTARYDVFIAYAHEDRAKVEELANHLDGIGYSVFWDFRIPAGQTWRSYIPAVLSASRCVIVAWSSHSVKSDMVLEEADEGKKQRKLIPVLLDSVELPLGFRSIHAADLSVWLPGFSDRALKALLEGVEGLVGLGAQ